MQDIIVIYHQRKSNDVNIVQTSVVKKVLPRFFWPSVFVQVVSFLIFFLFSAFCHPLEPRQLESVLGPPEFIKNSVFTHCISSGT